MEYINVSKAVLLRELKAIHKKAVDNKDIYLINDILDNRRYSSKDVLRSIESWLNDTGTSLRTKNLILSY